MVLLDGAQRPAFARVRATLARFALAALAVAFTGTVAAEGSRTLYPSAYGGAATDEGRGNLDLVGTGTVYLGIVPRRTFIYVYAQQGERILLGSRNRTANNVGAINVYTPQSFGEKGAETIPGSANFTCSAGTTGLITNRAEELAGPEAVSGGGNAAGYTPCVYTVTTTGIHGVLFGANTAGGGPNGSIATPATSDNSVSAWDVTVRANDTTTVDLNGRVFTYAWTVSTGGNLAGRLLYSDLFYVTSDGYRYRQRMTGIDPNAGTFFANTFGFLDTGEPLYKDVRGTVQGASNQPVNANLPAGVTPQRPQFPLFFSDVTPGAGNAATNAEVEKVLAALSIPAAPNPPQVNSFAFTYPPNGTSTAYLGLGGTFHFTVTDTISFEIIISRDGVDFDPASPTNRVITGQSGTGPYTVQWDGKDNAGNNFPVGTDYQFRITGRNGEVHFPFVDVEGNIYGGPRLTKLNGLIQDELVYYDDRGYVTRGGTAVGTLNGHLCGNAAWPQPTPNVALSGVDSSNPNAGGASKFARWWPQGDNDNATCFDAGQAFGDTKALNLWTYQRTQPQFGVLDIIDVADVTVAVDAPVATSPGATALVTLTFSNVGSLNAAGVTYAATLPTGLANVGCAGATCSYDPATGVVTITGLPGSLSPSQVTSLVLSYTAPPSGNVAIGATVGTATSQGPNLAPDADSGVTIVGGSIDADVLATVDAPPTSVPGGTVSVAIGYRNVGAGTAAGVTYSLTLPTGLTNVSCVGGPTCAYDAGTGAVTVTGLPATLASGASTPPFTLRYTAPATGSVTVTSVIATTSAEANVANNDAQGSTSVLGGSAVDIAASVAAPATASPGSTVDVAIEFRNAGSAAIAGATYSLQLSAGLANVSCAAPVTCTYNAGTGLVAVSGVPASLPVGFETDLTLRYTAPASGVVSVVATANVAGDGNSANNVASDETTVITASTGADVVSSVAPPSTAAPGAVVDVPVNYTNLGPSAAAGVSYTLTLPTGLTGVSCTGGGVTCTYAAGTGVVTVAGAPASLAPGQSVGFTLRYTSPAAGSVSVSSTISTTSAEPNLANNPDTGATAVVAGASTADVTTSVSPPPTALAGATVNVPVEFSNVGAVSAANVGYAIALTGAPGGVTVSFNAVACSYNAGTGAITGCGLPATLTPGQSLALVLTYVAPTGPANVQVTSTITTSTAQSNTGNDSATATTAIPTAVIDAVNDDFGATPVPGAAGGTTATVYTNDSLNGTPFAPGAVTPSITATGGLAGVTINASGQLVVPPNTPGGTYTVTYRICETANPTNCDTADVTVVVGVAAIVATDDDFTGTPIVGASGGTTATVFTNDTINGAAFVSSAVNVTLVANGGIGGLSIGANGQLTVPAGTPAGVYNASYSICEALNPTNCDTAIVAIRVGSAAIVATDDDFTATPVSGITGGTTPTVFTNDTLNGVAFASAAVNVSLLTSGGITGLAIGANGQLTVPGGTPGGTYTASYQICEALNPTNCSIADVVIVVGTATIAAIDDDFTAAPIANATGGTTATVFTNDTLNGVPFAASAVTVSIVTDGGLAAVAIGANGELTVPAGVPGGTYNVVYRICEVLNPDNCDTATALVLVTPPVIDAVDDDFTATPVDSLAGGTTSTIFANDTLGGAAFAESAVTVTIPNDGGIAGLTVAADGGLVVPAGTPVGTYLVTYRICDFVTPSNCDTATVQVVVGLVAPADLSIVKSVAPASPVVGSNVTFTLVASNAGPSAATSVVVTDNLPAGYAFVSATATQGAFAGSTWTIGTLANGASATLTVVATVNASGPYANTATIDGDQPDPDPTDDTSTAAPTPVATADLSIVKTVAPTTPAVGANVTFTLVASNSGPSNATGVVVTENLPAGYTFVSASATQGTFAGSTWTIGSLANGATATLTLVATVNASGPYLNTATIDGNETDPDPTDDTSTIGTTPAGTADLSIVKTVAPATPAVGANVTFTLVASNGGPSNATGVVVTENLPAGYTFVSASATQGTFAGSTWTIGSLADGSTATLTLVATVNASGPYANTATIDGDETDPDPTDDTSTVSTTPLGTADVSLVKTAPSQVTAGATITYTLAIANAGPSAANGTTFSDPMPAGLANIVATCGGATGGATCGAVGVVGNVVSGTIPSLPAGGAVLVTITATTPASGASLTNTAAVTTPPGVTDSNPDNDVDTTPTTVAVVGGPVEPISIPVDARWAMLLMAFALLGLGARQARRRLD